jgi:hypothetical protein
MKNGERKACGLPNTTGHAPIGTFFLTLKLHFLVEITKDNRPKRLQDVSLSSLAYVYVYLHAKTFCIN